jgi:hypothetical protein
VVHKSELPRITWFDYVPRGITPYNMFMEALDAIGEKVNGIFATWLAKQSTFEYMLWNYIVDFYETQELILEDTTYSLKGNEMHNELAFGSAISPLDEFRDGNSFLQWQDLDHLKSYQQNRLNDVHDGKITEYSMIGEIAGLKIRGTFDALDVESGTLLEFKTRARPTIPYFHERRNKMQLLTYYYLVKNYDLAQNDTDFPASRLSDYAKIQYLYQKDSSLLGELVIHVPYESTRYFKIIEYFKEFWFGQRRPTFSLKYCTLCKFCNRCFYFKRFYRSNYTNPRTKDQQDEES